ncbi:class F sortase [Iamia sp. SCSIO 61187]|uniref:class F sortase n=1 Tax=Iamia sp. SCSIO 61187 TaxID=2722752 RepID=UPI001C62C25F|nr:class F sortase [Iamia sp. SCSIO 61187]QYG93547.1 class F sortase [Iamia sp. SCSIO 61187]
MGRRLLLVLVVSALVAACGGDQGAAPRPAEQAAAPASSAPDPTTPETTEPGADEASPPAIGTQPATLDAVQASAAIPTPARLTIDRIGVDALVVPVGVEADGTMEVPAARDVGWYRFGPAPGGSGSAVLAAHVDFDGEEGAFFRLRQLAPGDAVVVTTADGATQRYVVTERRQVPKLDLSDSGVFDRTGPPRLTLITCGGEFDRDARSYRDNVVITAAPEG